MAQVWFSGKAFQWLPLMWAWGRIALMPRTFHFRSKGSNIPVFRELVQHSNGEKMIHPRSKRRETRIKRNSNTIVNAETINVPTSAVDYREG